MAVGLSKVDRVHPVTSPAFPVAGRGQQAVDLPLISLRRGVRQESLIIARRGGQTDQVPINPPQKGRPIGFRGGLQSPSLPLRPDKSIHRLENLGLGLGNPGRTQRHIRPMRFDGPNGHARPNQEDRQVSHGVGFSMPIPDPMTSEDPRRPRKPRLKTTRPTPTDCNLKPPQRVRRAWAMRPVPSPHSEFHR